jgi:hypothetical protein
LPSSPTASVVSPAFCLISRPASIRTWTGRWVLVSLCPKARKSSEIEPKRLSVLGRITGSFER